MNPENRQAHEFPTVDIKVSIPELAANAAYWIRDYPTHRTFAELYQECINLPEVVRSLKSLRPLDAPRHFWCGDQMMRRDKALSTLAEHTGAQGPVNPEMSLVLRRDYYRIGPPHFTVSDVEYCYVNAEAPVGEVIERILIHGEKVCCFDLQDYRGRRLAHDKSLLDYELWPARQDMNEAFPMQAVLLLRPRTSWLPYAILVCTVLLGALLGFWLLWTLLMPHPHP